MGEGFCCRRVSLGTGCLPEGKGQPRRCSQEGGAWKENWRPAETVHETQKHLPDASWPRAEGNRREPGATGRRPRSLDAAAAHRPGLLGCRLLLHLSSKSDELSSRRAGGSSSHTIGLRTSAPGQIRTWRKVPSSSDLLSAEGRAGDDGRVCQDGRGVCVCRPRRPRVPSTAPRFPSFPCGRSRVASPRLGDKPAPGLSPTPPPGTPGWRPGAKEHRRVSARGECVRPWRTSRGWRVRTCS